MSKKLLEESTIRQFMKLARLEPLSENFLEEKGWSGKKMKEEYDTSDMTPDEEVSTDIDMMEELDLFGEAEEEEMEMEVEEEPDMGEEEAETEAEITITPEQARAIMAVAEMLKGIMPELSEPEAEMEEPEAEMEEPEAEMAAGEEEEAAGEEEEAAAEEEALAEAVMKRVLSRLKKVK